MKKKVVAMILGLTMTGALAGGAVYSFAEDGGKVQLQIAGEESTEAAASADEAPADDADDADDAKTEATDITSLLNESSLDYTADKPSEESAQQFSYSNVADVAQAVMPSVVSITTSSVQEVQDWFSRRTYQYESEGAGSGFIIGSNEEELLICTNNHVVEGSDTLTVTFSDEESYTGTVKGTDASNDLAVVAVKLSDIKDETKDVIRVARVGSSDDAVVGSQVVAIGNALGYGQSVTTGIISAKDRTIEVGSEDGYSQTADSYTDLIQTDAAINPGNSGGALVNMNGEVIGINSAKASSNGVEGMGYAIPVAKALPILENLMSRETREKVDEKEMGYIGISGQGVSTEATELYGVPQGIYITQIGSGSPADDAGLVEGDIITSFDGVAVTSMSDLQNLMQYYKSGETIEVKIQTSAGEGKGFTEKTVEVTLGSREDARS